VTLNEVTTRKSYRAVCTNVIYFLRFTKWALLPSKSKSSVMSVFDIAKVSPLVSVVLIPLALKEFVFPLGDLTSNGVAWLISK